MSMLKLRLAAIGTLAAIIGISTLALTVILELLGAASIMTIAMLAVGFNLVQWLVAPYIIDMLYGVKEADPGAYPKLHRMVESLSLRAGLPKPRLMIADLPIPNAFAYGSPLTGNRVAVTSGLLNVLEDEEIEAVLGHELGHLKHRDVQVMMFASVLPSIFYILGRSFLYTAYFSGGRREERRGTTFVIGLVSLAIYFILSLFTLYLSRVREYYADSFSVGLMPDVRDGARRLMEALAKIVSHTGKLKASGVSLRVAGFKELFIADPDKAEADMAALARFSRDQELVQRVLRREVTLMDQVLELFSTHPNIVKRLRALEQYMRS